MSASFNKYFTMLVPSGASVSVGMPCTMYQDMVDLLVSAPATLPETVTFEVGNTDTDVIGTVWATLQDDTPASVAGPTAGKTRAYPHLLHARIFRIKLNGNAAADRTFHFSGQWTTY